MVLKGGHHLVVIKGLSEESGIVLSIELQWNPLRVNQEPEGTGGECGTLGIIGDFQCD